MKTSTTLVIVAIAAVLTVSFTATVLNTPSYAAKGGGATVEKGIPCGTPGGFTTGHNVQTPSGNDNAQCHVKHS